MVLILSCHFPWVQRPATCCCDMGSRTAGWGLQCHGCQMHAPRDVKSRASDYVLGRDWFVGPETDTNPKAAVGSYFGFDANVNHSLSGTLWLWLTYLLLTIQGEPGSPLRHVALCLKTTFRMRIECGILFQMCICQGIFFKISLENSPGFSWLTASTEVLSSKHVNLLTPGTCVVYRQGLRSWAWGSS